ncbi:MAG: hypothetical protein SGJ15_03740 [Bacteroidota bacterium]|nr:hypothetical protein [Bacteroidota bacterium]
MKKTILLLSAGTLVFIAVLAVYFGGKPAAENREAMYARAKVFQDSIANTIKSSMDQAAAPVPGGQVVTTVTPTSQGAPTNTAK